MPGRLDGKVAGVTGGGRGIGRSVSLLLAQEGAKVVVNDLGCEVDGTGSSKAPADAVVAEITRARGQARPSYDDVATMAGAERAVKTAVDSFGRLDIIVTCAGVAGEQMIGSVSEEEWQRVGIRQLKATFAPVKFAAILFRQQQSGRAVLFTSDAGMGAVGQAVQAAAGEGIIGFVRTLARDTGRYGMTANAISALARTRLSPRGVQVAAQSAPEALRRAGLGAASPTEAWQGPGSPDDPENVAPLAVWLCTEPASHVNGNVFGVRGGDIYLYSHPVVEKSIATIKRLSLDQIVDLAPKAFITPGGF